MGENSSNLSGIGSIVQAGWNVLDGLFGWSAKRQKNDTKELMALQQQYNLENMALEQQYAKEMFDYQGPGHQMELARAAGLNPLIVAQGNMNLGSASSADSASIDAGGAASAAAAFESNRLQEMLQIAQIANINSQTRLNEKNVGKAEAETNYIISNQKINEQQSDLKLKLGKYQLDFVLPSEVANNEANTKSIFANMRLIQPKIDLMMAQRDELWQSISSMNTKQKVELAEAWMKLDRHSLEKALIRVGISKSQSDILVNQANIDMIHQQAQNLKTTGELLAWEFHLNKKYGNLERGQKLYNMELQNESIAISNFFTPGMDFKEMDYKDNKMFTDALQSTGILFGALLGMSKMASQPANVQNSPVFLNSYPSAAGVGTVNPNPVTGSNYWERPALQPSHHAQ